MGTQKIRTKIFNVSCGFEERIKDMGDLNDFLDYFDSWVVDVFTNDTGDETYVVEFYEH